MKVKLDRRWDLLGKRYTVMEACQATEQAKPRVAGVVENDLQFLTVDGSLAEQTTSLS